eukprot:TRINITY_DN9534_c0_g2_i3.p1 TRINITY_DN9534_c0_g2~~TRINITY_DN9534_c0_g2_i3.p1  ORF type:complete len:971 (+),score=166.75 TRINITY_DN9534_c0_g2_i3:387-2915(+)
MKEHELDVVDLAWSPDGRFLCSGSLDNTITVWETSKFAKVSRLLGHTAFVKGVAWDPVGQYIASQSDDNSVIIWRTSDWGLQARITEPFTSHVSETFVTRLSWSPEGTLLAVPRGSNQKSHITSYIQRSTWDGNGDIVGHRHVVVVAKFSPTFLKQKNAEVGKEEYAGCCVLGSLDKGITVWLTNRPNPLAVITNLFENGVSDISWHPQGTSFFATSTDGTVAFVQFEDQDNIGTPATKAELKSIVESKYKDILLVSQKGQVLESTVQLMLEQENSNPSSTNIPFNSATPQKSIEATKPAVETPVRQGGEKVQVVEKSTAEIQKSQKEVRNEKGKRKILPVMIRSLESDAPIIALPTNGAMQSMLVESCAQSQTPVRKELEKTETSSPILSVNIVPQNTASNHSVSIISTNTPNGDHQSSNAPNKERSQPNTSTTSAPPAGSESGKQAATPLKKRKIAPTLIASANQPSTVGAGKSIGQSHGHGASAAPSSGSVNPSSQKGSVVHSSKELLLPPEPKAVVTFQAVPVSGQPVLLESRYEQGWSRLLCLKQNVAVWEDRLKGRITLLSGGVRGYAATTRDQYLHVYSTSGRRVLPPIALNDQACFLSFLDENILVVTCDAECRVWNINTAELRVSCNCSPLLAGSGTIDRIFANADGVPVAITTSGIGFTYHTGMHVWMRVVDEQFLQSEYHPRVTPKGPSSGPLSQLQSECLVKQPPHQQSAYVSDEQQKLHVTMSHLETMIASAIALKSSTEYKQWIMTYARYLCQTGSSARIVELCSDLLGPTKSAVAAKESLDHKSSLESMGINRHALLREILKVLGKSRQFQREVQEYHELLDQMDSS